MRITRKQLRKVIRESLTEYGVGREYDHLRPGGAQADDPMAWQSDWEDLNNLDRTIDQLISSDGEDLLDAAFGAGTFKPLHAEIDMEAIYDGGKEILDALQMLLPNRRPEELRAALEAWAAKNTQYGLVDANYDNHQSMVRGR
tara:strand:- start:70 stop:498 length:429 start_codon:yes stop_codon:yes gene_type:complete